MKKAFTLIELLVAVAVFMILFMIILAFINLAMGSTKSAHTKMLTADMRNTVDTINVKMRNANQESDGVYGFKTYEISGHSGEKVLVITVGDTDCMYVALEKGPGKGKLKTTTKNSCTSTPDPYVIADFNQEFNSKDVEVTQFDLTDKVVMTATDPNVVPYLKITITAKDRDVKFPDNIVTLTTAYTMDYLTVKELSK